MKCCHQNKCAKIFFQSSYFHNRSQMGSKNRSLFITIINIILFLAFWNEYNCLLSIYCLTCQSHIPGLITFLCERTPVSLRKNDENEIWWRLTLRCFRRRMSVAAGVPRQTSWAAWRQHAEPPVQDAGWLPQWMLRRRIRKVWTHSRPWRQWLILQTLQCPVNWDYTCVQKSNGY